jgi:general secretion pathway protein J
MSTPQRAKREAGFTLVELVAALIVIALTLGSVVTAVRLLGLSGERGARVIARQDMLSRGVDVLRRDIERLERVMRKREDALEFVFDGDEKSLTFVLIEPAVPSRPGPYFIFYYVEQGEGSNALVRGRVPYDAMAKDIRRLRPQDEVSVLEGPYDFRFAYLLREGGQESWIPRWLNHDRLPALIKLEMVGRGRAADLPPLVFRQRIDAEQGCIKDKAGPCTLRSGGALMVTTGAEGERKN